MVRDVGEPRQVELPEGGQGGEYELAGLVGDTGPAFREREGLEFGVGVAERREARVGDMGAFRDVKLSERGSCFGPCFGPRGEGKGPKASVGDGGASSEDK